MNLEIWKDIPGYEGQYQASTFGRIRSLDRIISQVGRGGKPFERRLKGRILKPGKYCKTGHLSLPLGRGTNGLPVHQLILLTFLGPVPEGCEVRHLNGVPTDNRLENLIYGSRTENILDVYAIGRAWRVLTTADVLEIRGALASGETGTSIARQFNVSDITVSRIKNGVTFRWLA
ncbi:NUMOD4 domain-containing protein [Paenibacillus glucanolyticus]|uniref:NUMOD4 domain-containing protein n=1 Tax=Paenibacillus glucanolyticus TaxID=59843 RepID=UPI0035D9A433